MRRSPQVPYSRPSRFASATAGGPRRAAQPGVGVLKVAVDGVLAEHEPRRDLAISEPLRDEAQHLELTRGEELLAGRSAPGHRRSTEAGQQLARPRSLAQRPRSRRGA